MVLKLNLKHICLDVLFTKYLLCNLIILLINHVLSITYNAILFNGVLYVQHH